LIHISGIGADPASSSLYIRSRGIGEQAVREVFGEATLIRPAVMFGADDAFVTIIIRLSPSGRFTFSNTVHSSPCPQSVAYGLEEVVHCWDFSGRATTVA